MKLILLSLVLSLLSSSLTVDLAIACSKTSGVASKATKNLTSPQAVLAVDPVQTAYFTRGMRHSSLALVASTHEVVLPGSSLQL